MGGAHIASPPRASLLQWPGAVEESGDIGTHRATLSSNVVLCTGPLGLPNWTKSRTFSLRFRLAL